MATQGTVSAYDPRTRSGRVLLDDGTELPFPAKALAGTGVRLLRPGQRVRFETDDGTKVTALQILTIH